MALKWNVSDEENEAVFLSTMDLDNAHLSFVSRYSGYKKVLARGFIFQ